MKTRIYPWVILLLTLPGLPLQAQHRGQLPDGTRQRIEESNKAYFQHISDNDVRSFARQYAVDCWVMVPGLPVHCGPEAPVDFFHEVLLRKGVRSGKFITIDLYAISGEMMAEVGFYHYYDTSGLEFDDGKYITLWKKADGQWKRFRESVSSSR